MVVRRLRDDYAMLTLQFIVVFMYVSVLVWSAEYLREFFPTGKLFSKYSFYIFETKKIERFSHVNQAA